jgi:hypothetical protein
MLIDPYRYTTAAPPPEPEPVYPFVSIGSTQPYRAVHMGPCVTTDDAIANYPMAPMGPCVTTDNTLAPWPIIYFDNCVMQEGT